MKEIVGEQPGHGGKGLEMRLDLENIYKYHAPKEGQAEKYQVIRATAHELAKIIEALCPDSREKSIAFTQLETSVMWANAAIARASE